MVRLLFEVPKHAEVVLVGFPGSSQPDGQDQPDPERLRLSRSMLDLVPGFGYLYDPSGRGLLQVSD